jgi:hypothetical protein
LWVAAKGHSEYAYFIYGVELELIKLKWSTEPNPILRGFSTSVSRVAGGYDYGVAPVYGRRSYAPTAAVAASGKSKISTRRRVLAETTWAANAAARAAAMSVISRGGEAGSRYPTRSWEDSVEGEQGRETTREGEQRISGGSGGDREEPTVSAWGPSSPANAPRRGSAAPLSPGSSFRAPGGASGAAGAVPPRHAGTPIGTRKARASSGGETGAAHVESSLQREFEELRGEYSALLERASRVGLYKLNPVPPALGKPPGFNP